MSRSKLNPETFWSIVAALRVGASFSDAARAARVSRATVGRWIRRGRAQREGEYRRFADACAQAEAEGELTLLARVNKAAERGHWRAAAWVLERRYPKRWGQRPYIVLEKRRADS